MEALIVAVVALIVMVVLEASYGIALALLRWTPVIAAGALAGWLAHRFGAEPLAALGLGFIVCLVVRHLLRPNRRFESQDEDFS